MKGIYVVGAPASGKTAMSVGLALRCLDEGLKVAYFKPVGSLPGPSLRVDEDAVLMKHLLNMEEPVEDICPFTVSPYYLSRYEPSEEFVQTVIEKYRLVSQGKDVVIIGAAPFPYSMAALKLDAASLAARLDASVLMVNRIESDFSIDSVILYNDYARKFGIEVIGNIFNHVPRPLLDKCEGVYKRYLEDHGYKVLGIIPRHVEVAAPTVAEYHEVLGGEILTGEEHMDRIVEDVLVGAMTMDSALSYLRRATNKAVITGGDRADLALAALETSTSVLILTGGLYPSVNVLARAAEKKVPVILVHEDTFTTIERLHAVSRRIHPDDERSIRLARELFEQYCDVEAIMAYIRP